MVWCAGRSTDRLPALLESIDVMGCPTDASVRQRSGAAAEDRRGFQRLLVAEVSLDHGGLIPGLEMTHGETAHERGMLKHVHRSPARPSVSEHGKRGRSARIDIARGTR
jgi:hypothetical protein